MHSSNGPLAPKFNLDPSWSPLLPPLSDPLSHSDSKKLTGYGKCEQIAGLMSQLAHRAVDLYWWLALSDSVNKSKDHSASYV